MKAKIMGWMDHLHIDRDNCLKEKKQLPWVAKTKQKV